MVSGLAGGAERVQVTGWPRFWVTAKEHGLTHAEVHKMYGVGPEKGALKALFIEEKVNEETDGLTERIEEWRGAAKAK